LQDLSPSEPEGDEKDLREEREDKVVTSCVRDRPNPFPFPFAPFGGFLDGEPPRTGCSLLSFLSHHQGFPPPPPSPDEPRPMPGPPTPYRCAICLAAFPSAWLLEQHNTLQHSTTSRASESGSPGEDKPFRCEQCGQSYRYRSAYLKHQEQNHRARLPADKLFTCDVCGMQFRYLKSFKKHRLNHALEKLHSKSPTDVDLLLRVRSNGMTDRSPRTTPNTPESSSDLTPKMLPMPTSPAASRPKESGRVTAPPFTSADSSTDQVSSSNEGLGDVSSLTDARSASVPVGKSDAFFKFSPDDYYCFRNKPQDLVSKGGKSDSEQDETVDSITYAMANNNEAFRYQQEASLMNLLRMDGNDRQREHRFSCPFCGKCVRSKENLKLHIRKHTGERPFVCLFCGRAFGGKSDLTRHLRIHTGERPYHCEMCGKCFARADYLSKHLTTHIHSHNTRPSFAPESR